MFIKSKEDISPCFLLDKEHHALGVHDDTSKFRGFTWDRYEATHLYIYIYQPISDEISLN